MLHPPVPPLPGKDEGPGQYQQNAANPHQQHTHLCREIGSGSVVGAGSLVLNTVPSNAMVAGAPATVKKHYKPD